MAPFVEDGEGGTALFGEEPGEFPQGGLRRDGDVVGGHGVHHPQALEQVHRGSLLPDPDAGAGEGERVHRILVQPLGNESADDGGEHQREHEVVVAG